MAPKKGTKKPPKGMAHKRLSPGYQIVDQKRSKPIRNQSWKVAPRPGTAGKTSNPVSEKCVFVFVRSLAPDEREAGLEMELSGNQTRDRKLFQNKSNRQNMNWDPLGVQLYRSSIGGSSWGSQGRSSGGAAMHSPSAPHHSPGALP